jgi:hypothetical protein
VVGRSVITGQWLAALFISLFIVHWYIGVHLFLKLPNNLGSLQKKLMYPLIISFLILAIAFFDKSFEMFFFLGLAFLSVIPLFNQLKKQPDAQVVSQVRVYFNQKLMIEYVGGLGLILNAVLIYFQIIPSAWLILLGVLGHLITVIYIIATGLYSKTFKSLR